MKSFIGAIIFICVALSANAQLLWKVSGNGLSSPSYIMGTHHLAPLSIKDGITGLQKAMDETQQVYGELKMSEIQSQATIQKMQKMMMIESDTTLTTLLSPEEYETANDGPEYGTQNQTSFLTEQHSSGGIHQTYWKL